MAEQSLKEFVDSLPEELRNIPDVFYAPYGFKLVEINGEKRWQSGTFEEWRAVIAEERGVELSTITEESRDACFNTNPWICGGPCVPGFFCQGVFVPGRGYIYCHCPGRSSAQKT